MRTRIKMIWLTVVSFIAAFFARLALPRPALVGPVETAGPIDDNNIPAFQAGVATIAAGSIAVPNVYLTEKSWIGLTRLTFPANVADAGELKVTQPAGPEDVEGYGMTFTIASTDAQDAGIVQWIIITDVSDMERCLPPGA